MRQAMVSGSPAPSRSPLPSGSPAPSRSLPPPALLPQLATPVFISVLLPRARPLQCDRAPRPAAPWRRSGPSCGVMQYAVTPAAGKSLYPASDPHNTWNGAIIYDSRLSVYHLYSPLYPPGSLGGATTLKHGIAPNITGPYTWDKAADLTIPLLAEFDGPKKVVYTDTDTNKTQYSLWFGGHVYTSLEPGGPFTMLQNFTYPGHNPAPIYHEGAFYTIESMAAGMALQLGIHTTRRCRTEIALPTTAGIYTTPSLVAGAKWTKYATIQQKGVPQGWMPEDPDMFVDKRNNWHIVNHAYNPHEWQHCSTSLLSTHFFSADSGKTWNFLPVEPCEFFLFVFLGPIDAACSLSFYSTCHHRVRVCADKHTVSYDDGTSHMFVTIERPTLFFDAAGALTHIHLAADLVSGDAGCGNRTVHAHFGHCPCDNCKYGDHGSTTIIALAA
jgi:hypothetical protein